MQNGPQLVSPKQVARVIGVSESSLKRWCDQGLIGTVRTAGGHRKMPIAEVIRFVREHDHKMANPELLGLPPVSDHAELGLTRSQARLTEALLAGNELVARQIVFDLYLAKHSLSIILDEVVAGAFREIGERWACESADIYQERRSCGIAVRVLFDIRRVQAAPDPAWPAMGGTIEGDLYEMPSTMVEMVLREAGFQATFLGTSLPIVSLARAIRETKPRLFWLSVSHIRAGYDLPSEFPMLTEACNEVGAALVVGGRELTGELRQRMTYSAFCDKMQHLEAFAKTLKRTTASPNRT